MNYKDFNMGTPISPSCGDSVYNLLLGQFLRDSSFTGEGLDFFRKYGIFLDNEYLLDREITVSSVSNNNNSSLEKRLIIECVSHNNFLQPFSKEENREYGFSTIYKCSGSLLREGSLFSASSVSFSNFRDDSDLYDDLRSIIHIFHPELQIDIFRDDQIGVLEAGDSPVTIHNNEVYFEEVERR